MQTTLLDYRKRKEETMNNKIPLIIGGIILVLAIIGGAAYFMMSTLETNISNSETTSENESNSGQMEMDSELSELPSDTNEQSLEAAETSTVEIKEYAYSPQTITVKKGTKVTWTNQDSVRHNVESDGEGDLDGPLLAKGESWDYTFNEVGTFNYLCGPHPYMKGTVIVTE